MRLRPSFLLLLLSAFLLAAGCERPQGTVPIAEIDDPNYTRGKSLIRQNRNQEALAAFLRVIERRGGDAPESHLEVGRLYHDNIKDPVAAIYHYRKFRELKPNAPQADLVLQLIDGAKRDFARTLPAQPLENLSQRNDLLDVVQRLQRENEQLRGELADNRAGLPSSPSRGAVATLPLESPGLSPRPVVVADRPAIIPSPAPVTPPASRPPTVTPAPAGRRHVVVSGDSLFSIARQFYGSPTNAKIDEIAAANPDQLPAGRNSPLRPGMELRIP